MEPCEQTFTPGPVARLQPCCVVAGSAPDSTPVPIVPRCGRSFMADLIYLLLTGLFFIVAGLILKAVERL